METKVRAPQIESRGDASGRITTQQAIRITGLKSPAAFHALRQLLEEGWDPATGASIPIPDELRISPLTAAQVKALPAAEAAEHQSLKKARAAWTRSRCMRVPVWGGHCMPGGEYRWSAARCAAWRVKAFGE